MHEVEKYAGFVYEWTNLVNGKKYIGSHIGKDSDSYIGSGVAFRKDLKEYGSMSFTRVILEYVNDIDDLAATEKMWLTKVNAKDNDLYYNKTNGSSITKKPKKLSLFRKLCATCNITPVAVNYTDPQGRTHYRSCCENCIRKEKKLPKRKPAWQAAGYKKKMVCDRCGFRARYSAQMLVYHMDGRLTNTEARNLKSVCRNCEVELAKSELPWRQGGLEPDV
jgi:hypothetical protein